MNFSQVAMLTFGCLLGLLVTGYNAQYYYPGVYPGAGAGDGTSSLGSGGALTLLGVFLIVFLLISQFNTSSTPSVSVVNLTG